jgi:hypothetical protein
MATDRSLAEQAFEDAKAEALSRCKKVFGNDAISSLLQQSTALEGVLKSVENEMVKQKPKDGTKRAAFLTSLVFFAKKVDVYSKAVDVYVNKSPDIASLVWGSFRVLLQVI